MLSARAPAPSEHKVHGSSALAALALARAASSEDDAAEPPVGSAGSLGGLSRELHPRAMPPPTPPLDIAAQAPHDLAAHRGSSGGRLSFMSCFGSLGASFGSERAAPMRAPAARAPRARNQPTSRCAAQPGLSSLRPCPLTSHRRPAPPAARCRRRPARPAGRRQPGGRLRGGHPPLLLLV
jgi:hypothetical protein